MLSVQHRVPATAMTTEPDNLAFQHEMQEALRVATTFYDDVVPTLLSKPCSLFRHLTNIVHLVSADIEGDLELVITETKRMRECLNKLVLDDMYEPFGLWPPSSGEFFRVYFSSLVNDAQTGIAICDTSEHCFFESRKTCSHKEYDAIELYTLMVELYALSEALTTALNLGLIRVHIFCKLRSPVDQYLNCKGRPAKNMIVTLIDAIGSHGPRLAQHPSPPKRCKICYEYSCSAKMFSVNKCLHTYCSSCMRKHVKAELHHAEKLPECPHEYCSSKLEIESCLEFLNPELYSRMSLRIQEVSIPPTERVYCPLSNCSAVMSKSEVEEYTATSSTASRGTGVRKCVKCQRLFCINCKIAWHYDKFTCSYYSKKLSANETKLKALAKRKGWKQCIKCKNLVELGIGCRHITCRCGYEFCYMCGAKWMSCGCSRKQTLTSRILMFFFDRL